MGITGKGLEMRKLWVFYVTGGEGFKLQIKGNPIMMHEGGTSILRCLCTDQEAVDLEQVMLQHHCKVLSNCPMETKEQAVERKNLLQVLGGGRSFPCVRCPSCTWFDPYLESLCGAGKAFGKKGWEDSIIESSLLKEKFRSDLEKCPLQEGDV